ncbi:MAG: ABC transporter substrate-binding protein [Actinomycetota bacterium]
MKASFPSGRTTALALAGVLLLGAACGSDDEGDDSTAQPATGGSETLGDDSNDAAATVDDTTNEAGAQPDAALDPQRVVAVEGRAPLDHALALGLPVIGHGFEASPFLDDAIRDAGGVDPLWDGDLNLEAIAAADPDLIISRERFSEEFGEELQEIAPVFAPSYDEPWQDISEALSQLTGTTDEHAALIDIYDARVAEIARERSDVLDQPILHMQPWAGDGTYVFDDGWLPGQLITAVGGTLSNSMQRVEEPSELYSPENIDRALEGAAAAILVVNNDDDVQSLDTNPLWTASELASQEMFVMHDTNVNLGGPITVLAVLDIIDGLYAQLQEAS